jgi:hypothetical protein
MSNKYDDTPHQDDLKKAFHNDMLNIYASAKEIGYNATYFIQMISGLGGYEAAIKLIHTSKPSDGFAKLWELKRLDLSVEAHVLKREYDYLFSDDERKLCYDRLKEYGYTSPLEPIRFPDNNSV